MAVNDDLLDRSIGRQAALLRYGSSTTRDVLKVLEDARDQIQETLVQRLSASLGGFDRGPVTTARVAAQLQALNTVIGDAHAAAGQELLRDLRQLGVAESDFQLRMLKGVLPIEARFVGPPSTEVLVSAVTNLPFEGRFFEEHLSDLALSQFRSVSKAVQIGVVNGDTLDQIVRRVMGTKRLRFSDGALSSRQRRAQIEAVVRSSVNHTATQARELVWKDNQDLIKGVEIVATLDGRTSLICQIEDGKVYDVGKGPRPPFHFNCRTTTVPVTKSLSEITGFDSANISDDVRASVNGQVPAKLTYNDWLKNRATIAEQNAALGVARAKLLRANPSLNVAQLGNAFGQPLTLQQLHRVHPEFFDGLDPDDLRFVRRVGGIAGRTRTG